MRSVHKMTRVRYDKRTGKESREVTYFISSHTDPEKVFKMIREHWSVENNIGYCLDVIFREDQSLKIRGDAAKTGSPSSSWAVCERKRGGPMMIARR